MRKIFCVEKVLKQKVKLFILLIVFFPVFLFSEPDFRTHHVTQEELSDLLDNWHARGKDDRIKKLERVYPDAFQGLDLSQAYYETGMRYYYKAERLTALRFFLDGFSIFSQSTFKYRCAYRASKVLYQNQNRESALYYINRVLEHSEGEIKQEAARLKKRIRWEYFSRFEGLPDDSVSDIEFDGDDVWIALWTGGVSRFTRSSGLMRIFRARKNELISDHVRSIGISHTRVWLGTYDGLCFYDKKTAQWSRRVHDLGRNPVKKLYPTRNGFYAAVLRKGLFQYDSTKDRWNKIFNASINVSGIVETRNALFVGTLDKGVFQIQKGKVKSIVSHLTVKTLAYGEGRLWIGTYGQGLQVWNPETKKIERVYRHSENFSSDYVESLLFVPGKLLVGTLGGGVMVLSRTSFNPIKQLTVLDGLPSPDVVEIQSEGSRVWFGTLSGGVGILLTEDFGDL